MPTPTKVAAPPVAQSTVPSTASSSHSSNEGTVSAQSEGGLAGSFAKRKGPLSMADFLANRLRPRSAKELKNENPLPKGREGISSPVIPEGSGLASLRDRLFGNQESKEEETVNDPETTKQEKEANKQDAEAPEVTPEEKEQQEQGQAPKEESKAPTETENTAIASSSDGITNAPEANPSGNTSTETTPEIKEPEEEALPGEQQTIKVSTAADDDGSTDGSSPPEDSASPSEVTTGGKPEVKDPMAGKKPEDALAEMTGGPGAMQEMGEVAAPDLDTSDSAALTHSLTGGGILSMAKGMESVGPAASEAKSNESSTAQEGLPEIDQPTGLVPGEDQDHKKIIPPKGNAPNLKNDGVRQTGEMDTSFIGPKSPVPGSNIPRTTKSSLNSWGGFMSRMNSLPKRDPDLKTSIGSRPGVDLTGDADTGQNDKNEAQADQEVQAQQGQADNATYQDFGENNVYPTLDTETMSPNTEMSTPENWESSEGGTKMPEIPAHLQVGLDPQFEAEYSGKVDEEKAKQDEEKAKYESDVASEQATKMEEIEEENRKSGEEQKIVRAEGRSEIDGYREDWREENEAIKSEFKGKSETERTKVDAEVEAEVSSANEDVETEYTRTEKENEAEQAKSDKKVRDEQAAAEAKKKDKSWWDKVVDAVSDLFNALKEFVNKVFDELRAFVKKAIEAAKAFANKVIEAARKAVVGFIEVFAEVLKGFVSIALAAFPEVAERINGYIDKAKDKAIAGVNAIAEGLKKAVSFLLDALGAAIDFILSVYQAYINLMLDILEFLTVGLIRILEFLINLSMSIALMPFMLPAQLLAEAIGTDVSEPLEGTERTEPEIGKFDQFLAENNQGLDPEGRVIDLPVPESNDPSAEDYPDGAAPDGSIVGDPGDLPYKDPLSDSDVQHDPESPISMDTIEDMPELEEGQNYELGGASGPDVVQTKDLQAAMFGGEQQETEEEEGSIGPGMNPADMNLGMNPDDAKEDSPDFPNMTDQAKLDYQIEKMGMNSDEMDPKDESAPENPALDVPGLVGKTGKLSIGQRIDFASSQMMKGMEMWWEENKGYVYATLAGIAILGGVVTFFTAGAGLVPYLQLVMNVMMAIFIAQAVSRVKDLLWEFLQLAWDGDVVASSKKLARVLAVIIFEFIFTYLLKKIGSVLKRIQAMIKATRFGRKMAVGMYRTSKAVKNAFNSTRAVKGIKGLSVRASKYVFALYNKLYGYGARKLSELRKLILKKFGFKRLWLERHGNYIELWAEFNAKIRLSRSKVQNNKSAQNKPTTSKPNQGPKKNIEADQPKVGGLKKGTDPPGLGEKMNVSSYSKSARNSVKDKMTPDHIPSSAALNKYMEKKLGRPLTKNEAKELHQKGTTMLYETKLHQQLSRTYGGRNTKAQINADANDLYLAAKKDMDALRAPLLESGVSADEITRTFDLIHELNRALNIY